MKFKNKTTGEIVSCSPTLLNAARVSAQNRKRLFWVGELVNGKYKQVIIPQPEDRGIFIIRKLTPVECERLQSLPDNFSKYGMVLQIEKDYDNIGVWNSVLSKIANAKSKQISVPVLCTTSEIRGTEVLNFLKNKNQENADIVIDWQSQENSVISTIRICIGTKTLFTQIKLENITEQQLEASTDIYETLMANGGIETLWKNISEELSAEMKSCIISTLTNLIIGLRTFMSVQERSICLFTTNLKNLLLNSSKTKQSFLRTEHTSLISNTQRYKALGNAFNVEVVAHILRRCRGRS